MISIVETAFECFMLYTRLKESGTRMYLVEDPVLAGLLELRIDVCVICFLLR